MKLVTNVRLAGTVILLMGMLAANAKAASITAYGWITTDALVNSTGASASSLANAICHNGSGACTQANADVIFTTTGINFRTLAINATISQWLASSITPVNLLFGSNATLNTLVSPTIWEFIGTTLPLYGTPTNPQPISYYHDDGLTLTVNGQTIINSPGPGDARGATGGIYTGGATAGAPFDLIYTECCAGPAILQVGLPTTIPEPTSSFLFGSGLFGFAFLFRRKNI